MSNKSNPIVQTSKGNAFSCFPVTLLAFIVNKEKEILLLSHPNRPGTWEVVNGIMDPRETVLAGTMRELHEEIGDEVKVRPLGTIHTYSFHYDSEVHYMISICYLFEFVAGEILPSDDMKGSKYKWWNLSDIESEEIVISVPPGRKWILRRAVELYNLWKDKSRIELQPPLTNRGENKYQ